MANEIHDTLLQNLAATALELSNVCAEFAPTAPVQNELGRISRALEKSIGEAQQSIWDLRSRQHTPEEFAAEASGADLQRFFEERLEAGSTNLYAESLEFMERYVVTRVLSVCAGNQSKAARMLGITRGCLRSKVRALKVSIDTLVQIEGEPLEV